jgi:hypothetical protein
MWHNTLPPQFVDFFSLCQSRIVNVHSGVLTNCDHTSEWIHWVGAFIRIDMEWAVQEHPLLPFILPVRNIQFSLYLLYTSYKVARSRLRLTINRPFRLSYILLLVTITMIMWVQPTMFSTLKT